MKRDYLNRTLFNRSISFIMMGMVLLLSLFFMANPNQTNTVFSDSSLPISSVTPSFSTSLSSMDSIDSMEISDADHTSCQACNDCINSTMADCLDCANACFGCSLFILASDANHDAISLISSLEISYRAERYLIALDLILPPPLIA